MCTILGLSGRPSEKSVYFWSATLFGFGCLLVTRFRCTFIDISGYTIKSTFCSRRFGIGLVLFLILFNNMSLKNVIPLYLTMAKSRGRQFFLRQHSDWKKKMIQLLCSFKAFYGAPVPLQEHFEIYLQLLIPSTIINCLVTCLELELNNADINFNPSTAFRAKDETSVLFSSTFIPLL